MDKVHYLASLTKEELLERCKPYIQTWTDKSDHSDEIYFTLLEDMAKITTIRKGLKCRVCKEKPVDISGKTAEYICLDCFADLDRLKILRLKNRNLNYSPEIETKPEPEIDLVPVYNYLRKIDAESSRIHQKKIKFLEEMFNA